MNICLLYSQESGLPQPPTHEAEYDDAKYEPSKDVKTKMASIFGGIKQFDREKLKETETVVKNLPTVTDYTAHEDVEEVKEIYTDPVLVKELAERLATMILESKHTVFHTGAGISTAAKLPDYRGIVTLKCTNA